VHESSIQGTSQSVISSQHICILGTISEIWLGKLGFSAHNSQHQCKAETPTSRLRRCKINTIM